MRASRLPFVFQDQKPKEPVSKGGDEEEAYGEVDRTVSSRTVKNPGIAADVVAGYETPWWAEAKKADADALAGGPRCSRTRRCSGTRARRTRRGAPRDALRRGAGLRGGEECPRALAAAGADVGHQERAGGGLTPLHVAVGYGRAAAVRTLLELGADPEAPDEQGRTPLELVQQVLEKTPKGNPAAFQLRQGREAAQEPGEGRLQASGRGGEGDRRAGRRQVAGVSGAWCLVEWRDGGEREWAKAPWVAEETPYVLQKHP
ncbi:putative signal recognition particle 43 kDa protein, chloroplastic [Panicum miliaceum]|uniref:Signal recognition particle 43 kDa protein, chloroplastic n=1 Tax=Panicum miliaceum TaxID=4540 RepID=A0A3L6QCT2_PANMI|nr:putative signal recognition particle 43 kDa protein, chloroplastic [Panicum miliaceum]